MKKIRANKIRIYPTSEQASVLRQRIGASRFCWNWCLAKWKEEYESGNKPTPFKIDKLFRKNKPEWFSEMDSLQVNTVVDNLGSAFKNFFDKRSKYPKFKSKSSNDTYQTNPQGIKVDDKLLKLPKLNKIKMAEKLFYTGKFCGKITISCTAGRWYVSIPVEVSEEDVGLLGSEITAVSAKADMIVACKDYQGSNVSHLRLQSTQSFQSPCGLEGSNVCVVGVDLGINKFATLSTGEEIENPRYYKKTERRLKIRQRKLTKKVKGSKNYAKAKHKVARTHASIENKRKGFIHRTTAELTKKFDIVAIEDLNVEGMKSGNLSKSISDVAFAEFRRQVEYKGKYHVIDRWYPSSKTCNVCDYRYDLSRSELNWTCPSCGTNHDRDYNAALNIAKQAIREMNSVKE